MAAVLKAGGVIEWFKKGCYVNNQFNRDQDNRWQYVIKVMGAFTALQNHYSQCELGIFLNPDTGTYERLRIIPQCPRPSKN
jgi:hypothetical protein